MPNSTAESTILVQLLYMPMLFFSGTTIPSRILPNWLQIAAQFLPSAYLLSGLQAIVLQQESILRRTGRAVLALLLHGGLALFLAMKLFRWEKEQKLTGSAKLWVLAAFLPFIVLGGYQAYSKESINKSRLLDRQHAPQSRPALPKRAASSLATAACWKMPRCSSATARSKQIFTRTAPSAKAA